ncbi:MAG: nucleotidyltransferase domain-containing protein [Nanoarchaeota archaeon]
MLKILNSFKPFFEDTHREYSVREYGRICKVSPPTASTFLKKAENQGILLSKKQGIYIFYRANRNSSFFKDIAKTYWRLTLKQIMGEMNKDFLFKRPILFGSVAKAENTAESDLDIFVDINKRSINLENIEKKLKRNIQIHFKNSLNNENLKKNIENGVIIE